MKSRRILFLSAAIAMLVSTATTRASADQDFEDRGGRGEPYEIGLWGDLPYSDVQAIVGVPNLIADMNRQPLAFTIHDGDLKAGSGTPGSVTPTTCSDALYVQARGFFNALRAPAMLTPGDNDWTDCDRPANGGFSSRERLDTSVRCSSPHRSRSASGGCTRKCRRLRCASA